MNYKKIAPGIFLPETNSPDPIFLEDLENRLIELNNQKEIIPTNQELIELGKMHHPAFDTNIDLEILELINFIANLKKL